MYARCFCRARLGIQAPLVSVETHITPSENASFNIVGLPETAVRESRDRVRSAIINSGYKFPYDRITVNLAPADLPKEGGRFDLAIAASILAASNQLQSAQLDYYELIAELSLNGQLRKVVGILPAAMQAQRSQHLLIAAQDNASEAMLVDGIRAHAATNLLEVCAHLNQELELPLASRSESPPTSNTQLDISDIRGQLQAKRALTIAAAGGHNMLMVGPPGSGKSMLAARLAGILPAMSQREALETAAVHSVAGQDLKLLTQRPFRNPHHSASAVALIGGSSSLKPGEISLAHHGVLFLDELTEFERRVLENLREPMESGEVVIARAAGSVRYPARFQLVAALNPCPCGYFGSSSKKCSCSSEQIKRYQMRISGPLLDRIDLVVNVREIASAEMLGEQPQASTSAEVRAAVAAARARQMQRQGKSNSHLGAQETERFCAPSAAQKHMLSQAISKLALSMRAYHRVLRLARSIADLEASANISDAHIREAIAYRRSDLLN